MCASSPGKISAIARLGITTIETRAHVQTGPSRECPVCKWVASPKVVPLVDETVVPSDPPLGEGSWRADSRPLSH